MKNFSEMTKIKSNLRIYLLLIINLISIVAIIGCVTTPVETKDVKEFTTAGPSSEIPFATPDILRLHEANLAKEYIIGPGDRIFIEIWNRERLSGEHLVGPFGNITLPILGEFEIGGKSIKEASKGIQALYTGYYDEPSVTIRILEYMNNKVYVLGKVSNPGVVHLDGQATLLEALSIAGGLPSTDKTIFLSKCYIIRGKEQIIWIDLLQLLHKANTKLNVRLANNDIIYIPENIDSAVFVMGEVRNPGSYPIQTTGLSVLDAVNLAGGPTEDGNIKKIRLIRGLKEQEGVKTIDMASILEKGDFSLNFILKDNDIVYIPKKGIASFNYYLRQLDPFMNTFISGALLNDALTD
jgi:polysaccharide export outer membrane protein